MTSPRRVVLVTTHYPPLVGGAATYFSLLANALASQATDVIVLTTRAPGYPGLSREGNLEVWRRLPRLATAPDLLRKTVQAAFTFGCLTAIRLMRKMDVVHTHGSKSVTVGSAFFSSLFGVPIIYDVQDFFSRPKIIRRGTAPRYIATGGAVADRLISLGVHRNRILIIPSIPSDVVRSRPLPPRRPSADCRCLFVGELHHRVKGSDILLEAFASVHERNPAITLDIVGEGPDRPADEATVRRHALEAVVTFKGLLSPESVHEEMSRADILIVASRSEAMPRVILEAFAVGVPVIATDVGGIREAVRDGETGLLVPAENPTALAEAIVRLSADPATRIAMGARGRAWIDQLPTWSRLAGTIASFYDVSRSSKMST